MEQKLYEKTKMIEFKLENLQERQEKTKNTLNGV